jgi:hypothetical protein
MPAKLRFLPFHPALASNLRLTHILQNKIGSVVSRLPWLPS